MLWRLILIVLNVFCVGVDAKALSINANDPYTIFLLVLNAVAASVGIVSLLHKFESKE